ncbi:MAG: 3'(2'),5'-bisphosphate nucleotidase CysQ [Acetobacteraceae bacterium]|nr:3'(2'),5'-bisphosphate nucleotidase CysQ [Acetobacteraceae bacterium]
MNDRALLDLAFDLARRAGALILQVRARGFTTTAKPDESPVTEADHAAEALIVAGLRAATPDIPVVAEEEIAAGHVPADAETLWVVDPLDGTREFARRGDDFAVCIGLVRHGAPVLGVVGQPATGALFGGIVGHGAWKREGGTERPIRARRAPAAGLSVVASRHYADDPRLKPFLAGRKVAEILHMGSALKFCRVAEGIADLYPRFGPTMEWDTAAAQAVVEAAGGSIRLLDGGGVLRYGKPEWRNPPFVCSGLA